MNLPKFLGTAILAMLVAGPASAEEFSAWEPVLAGHSLRTPAGETLRLDELRGDVVVVNFWASWCAPCRRELPVLDGWADDLEGARIVAVSVDREVDKAQRFLERAGLSLPLYHDGPDGLARSLDLPSLPCTVVLDGRGRVVKVARDGSLESLQALRGTVKALLSKPSSAEVSG